MGLRDRYILEISKEKNVPEEKGPPGNAMIDDMKFALEFLRFNGKNDATPNEVAAVAKVAEFYRKHYKEKKPEIKSSTVEDEMAEDREI